MPTDSALSWGILLFFTIYGFCQMVKAVIEADKKRHGGDRNDW